jgi:hypothetical protein
MVSKSPGLYIMEIGQLVYKILKITATVRGKSYLLFHKKMKSNNEHLSVDCRGVNGDVVHWPGF